MICEFDYCIYNREQHCALSGIKIDSLGMCESCEVVAIPKTTLDELKGKRLCEIQAIHL